MNAHMNFAVPETGATNGHVSNRSEVNKSEFFIGLFMQTTDNSRPIYAFSPHLKSPRIIFTSCAG